MTLLLIEGFDHLNSGQVAVKGWPVPGGRQSMQTGRFGGQCIALTGGPGGSNDTCFKSFTAASTVTLGFAFLAASSTNLGVVIGIIRAAGGNACQIALASGGFLRILNSGGTQLAIGTTPLSAGNWYYIEVKATQAGASGSVELHLNGAVEIAATTVNIGSTNFDSVFFTGDTTNTNGSAGFRFDDIYVCNSSGTTNTTFLGDVRVTTHYPTADGAHSQWSPTGGGAHYTQVNEHPPDGDTTYVSDANPGDIDTYAFDAVDGGATVFGVQTNLYARKDDANTRQIAPVVRQASTDYVGTTVALGSSYAYFSQVYDQDPTGANWTAANFNADQFGVKEIA